MKIGGIDAVNHKESGNHIEESPKSWKHRKTQNIKKIGINNKNNQNQATAEAKKDNKICRVVSVSGSRLKKKVCSTVEEEEDRAKKSQRILREQQNRERVRSGMPDPG